jgi:hypothetical protein
VTIAVKLLCSLLCLSDDRSPSAINHSSERKYGNASRIASLAAQSARASLRSSLIPVGDSQGLTQQLWPRRSGTPCRADSQARGIEGSISPATN